VLGYRQINRQDAWDGAGSGGTTLDAKSLSPQRNRIVLGWPETPWDDLGLFHSIINEPSKPLFCMALAAASQTFTVTFTVNLPGNSIGAGFRAVRRKLTFRDLSTSIDSHDDCRHHRGAVRAGPRSTEETRASYVLGYCHY
jgi:hypothetical protein